MLLFDSFLEGGGWGGSGLKEQRQPQAEYKILIAISLYATQVSMCPPPQILYSVWLIFKYQQQITFPFKSRFGLALFQQEKDSTAENIKVRFI